MQISTAVAGDGTAWTEAVIELAEYAGKTVEVAFVLYAQNCCWGDVSSGWYIDDLSIGEGLQEPFVRGDPNGDGLVEISDPILILTFLFSSGVEIGCLKSADVDDSGSLDITDAVRILRHLFVGGQPPSAPYPDCGLDPTPDGLSCAAYSPCQG